MRNDPRPPSGEMAWATAFVAFLGASQLWLSYQNGSWKRAVAGVIMLGLSLGIWYRLTLARRAAILVLAAGSLFQLYAMLQVEFSMSKFLWIVAPLLCCWFLWRAPDDEPMVEAEDDATRRKDQVAFVALLREPVALDEAAVLAAARRFAGPEAAVFGSGMFWAVRAQGIVLRISTADRPYFSHPSTVEAPESVHKALREHTAWLAIDVADPQQSPLPAAYALMARLMAELVPDHALAVHATVERGFVVCSPDWPNRFRAASPFVAGSGKH